MDRRETGMSQTVRVAVASSDGKVVNTHFGRAEQFLIFDVTSADYSFIELRKSEPICTGGEHSNNALDDRLKLLKDCEIVLASMIGYSVIASLIAKGITPLQVTGLVDDVLKKLAASNIKFKRKA